LQLFDHIPPPGAALHRERRIGQSIETAQPHRQIPPVRRRDLPPAQLAGSGVDVIEGELLSVDVQSAYDRHRDLLKLHD
jgi:hypothetical protein